MITPAPNKYRYKAVSAAGEINEGIMEAGDRAEVIQRIQALGQVPIKAEEMGTSWLSTLFTAKLRTAGRAKPRVLIGLFRQMETLLRAGVPLDRALDLLREQAASDAEAAILQALLQRVRSGNALSDAMAEEGVFPEFCVSIVRAGEAGGSLDASLGELATQLERTQKATERFQSAMMYPAIVVAACGLSFIFLFTFIVPRFKVFFENTDAPIPFVTRTVLATGVFFEQHGMMVAVGAVSLAWLAVRLARSSAHRERLGKHLLSIPFVGTLILKSEMGRFCRVLGTLLKNGVTLTRGLEIAGQTFRNPVLAGALVDATRYVKEGKGLSGPLLDTGVFPPFALRLLRIGEEAARLDDMLMEIAEAYDRETERDMERLLALLGPAITIVLGTMVALVIGSILVALLGVYQLTF
jgi:general secretion pathway protein F